ncbi:hypothetical protein BOTBODRAFT_377839 [Botryobasidium botryosum FD-172 SS1]|uniref:Histone deacetylase complex subunit SAP30 Sin3 binding domain-containing protein n=1 Tax=Botryobasidium botryosum (strain FD-172 SS1) TaxID=930990 RepID=A0A067N6T4_BOTB1|nr:hypothetical protein BOTBODRAFT_377839 [Botryobasidium botryosum FD-172 SS1]
MPPKAIPGTANTSSRARKRVDEGSVGGEDTPMSSGVPPGGTPNGAGAAAKRRGGPSDGVSGVGSGGGANGGGGANSNGGSGGGVGAAGVGTSASTGAGASSIPPVAKRRRGDEFAGGVNGGSNGVGSGQRRNGGGNANMSMNVDEESKVIMDFGKLPVSSLTSYLTGFDLVPPMHPSPLSYSNPPLPHYLVNPPTHAQVHVQHPPSPGPSSATPANRPRRDPKLTREREQRRRSSRLAEEELVRDRRPPIMWDLVETERAMATIAQRHFEKVSVREGDTITAFLYAVRTKERTLKILPQ